MKALIVSHYDDVVSARPEARLVLELFRRGVAMEVVTNKPSPHTREFQQAGIPVHFRHPEAKISLRSIRWLRQLLREGKFDILHLFNSRAASNGVWAAVGLPVKVVTYRGAGGLYWHDPFAWLSHLHPRVDRISCLSEYVQRQVDGQFHFRRKKTLVHYKAFLPEWFEGIPESDLREEGVPAGALVVGCVANYRRVKGLETLLRSASLFSRNPRIHLVLVGRDTDHPRLGKMISQSPMRERIHVLGHREDVYALMQGFHIYVQPSINEGLSKSVMEAMLLGLPCVVTNAGGMPELFPGPESGIVVGIRDHHAMAGAIMRLADNPAVRQAMGKEGRSAILENFSVDAYVRGVLDMYGELTG